MTISAGDVSLESLFPKLITASDFLATKLVEENDRLQELRNARAETQEHVGKKL